MSAHRTGSARLPRGMVVTGILLTLVWVGGALASEQATTGTTVGGLVGIAVAALLVGGAYLLARRGGSTPTR